MTDSVAVILTLDRADLLMRWEAAFGRSPPLHTHACFLRLALAWQFQAKEKGINKTKNNRSVPAKPATGSGLRLGTKLVREWQGKTHHVSITKTGYEYAGKTWRSLSAIAREITGTAWSGPTFFGIRK